MKYLPRTEDGEIRKPLEYRMISYIKYKGKLICIQRDRWGKFHVDVDNRRTQCSLTAEEIVRYLANILEGGK